MAEYNPSKKYSEMFVLCAIESGYGIFINLFLLDKRF